MPAFTFEDRTGAVTMTGDGYLQDRGGNPVTVISTADTSRCHLHLTFKCTMNIFANTTRLVPTISFEKLGPGVEASVQGTPYVLPYIQANTEFTVPTNICFDVTPTLAVGVYHCAITCVVQQWDPVNNVWNPMPCAGFTEIPVVQFY